MDPCSTFTVKVLVNYDLHHCSGDSLVSYGYVKTLQKAFVKNHHKSIPFLVKIIMMMLIILIYHVRTQKSPWPC